MALRRRSILPHSGNPVSLLAYGKINLHLSVFRKRPDATLHTLGSLFHTISLADRLTIVPARVFNMAIGGKVVTTTGGRDGKPAAIGAGTVYYGDRGLYEDNILERTWRLLQEMYGLGGEVDIVLEKRIPLGAGLGGGSSDAAALITWVDKVYGLHLSQQAKVEVALKLGSDVPFFLSGGMAWVEEVGASVIPLNFTLEALNHKKRAKRTKNQAYEGPIHEKYRDQGLDQGFDNSHQHDKREATKGEFEKDEKGIYAPLWIIESDVAIKTSEAYERFVTLDERGKYERLKAAICDIEGGAGDSGEKKSTEATSEVATRKAATHRITERITEKNKWNNWNEENVRDKAEQTLALLRAQASNAFQKKTLEASSVLANIYSSLSKYAEYTLLTGSGSAFFCQIHGMKADFLKKLPGVRAIHPVHFTSSGHRFLASNR